MARRGRGPTVQVGRQGPGLVGTMARTAVIAGTATATVGMTKAMMGGGSSKQAAASQDAAQQQQITELEAQQAQLAAQQQAMAAQQAAPAAPAAPAPGSLDDIAQQIQKLQVMKEQGLLTEEEFNAKKQQILGI